jgi:hypothetical protein
MDAHGRSQEALRVRGLLLLVGLAGALVAALATADLCAADAAQLESWRAWIAEMKSAERGPFSRVLWFCQDGTIQPPVLDGCLEHGGGSQHGEWSERTRSLREQGYWIANFLSPLEPEETLSRPDFADWFGQVQVEKFLVGLDDGWILRRAMFYRGAIQEEGERRGAERLLKAMADQPYWLEGGLPLLRTAAKVLPHGSDTQSVTTVRQDSANLSNRDPGFKALRAKIHGAPDAGDAERVRAYATSQAPPELRAAYTTLATEIDHLYAPQPLPELLRERAGQYDRGPWLQAILLRFADELEAADSPAVSFQVTGGLLAELRAALPRIQSAQVRLQVIDLGLAAEQAHFRAAAELRPGLQALSKRELLELAFAGVDASYGAGLLNARLRRELHYHREVLARTELPLADFRPILADLARAPGWGMAALRMHYQGPMQKLAELEPAANLFIQDQLRASPLLFYADVLEVLLQGAGRLAGVHHHLFDQQIGFGLTALNPGLAHGELHADLVELSELEPEAIQPAGIYLLPETIAELPPVAGILTAGEGNPLSHVQLLARNLGIPNVVVAHHLVQALTAHDGEEVVLAVSPGGQVQIKAWSADWEPYFADVAKDRVVIRPDLDKLDLSRTAPVSLNELSAADSGRTVGPKAAKLGELKRHYPDAVADGVALPFGVFRQAALERPWPGDASGRTTVFEWMQGQYRSLDALPEGPERSQRTEAFRAELHATIAATPITGELRRALLNELQEVFGRGPLSGPLPGLFIRSDTNVEDLPGFTGAGLNLTLPNVVGLDALLEGIPRVWASPFTARAFAWRQALMERPEHVYTSILLLESVPIEKSGVLVTRDIDTGAADVLSVAVNEGIGGAVDGQAAESLRIPLDGGRVQVLATATAPSRRALRPEGGVASVPASGSDTVLDPAEIERLVEFARHLPERFPSIVDADGQPAPADVEFGFLDGRLRLFQIRPFLNSPAARGSDYLSRLDRELETTRDRVVDLDERPLH